MIVTDDGTLCQWLRDNSSGNYRLAAFAADRIEDLKKQLEIRNREFEALSKRLKETAVSQAEWEPLQKEWFGDKYAAMQPVDAIRAKVEDLEEEVSEHEFYEEMSRKEIRDTWAKARDAQGQTEAFRILERMVDRLGYGRFENNPSLV